MPNLILDLSTVLEVLSNTAARFTRTNSEYFSVADSAILNFSGDKSFTLVGWMRPVTNTAGEFIAVIGKWSGTAGAQQYLLGWRGSTNRFSMLVNNGASVVAADPNITALVNGTNYFVVGYHDAAGNVIGVSAQNATRTTAAQAGNLQASTQAVEIGRSNSTAIHYADAVMQSVAVFNSVITTTEQTWLYNAGAGRRFADLETQPALLAKCVAWWDLGESGGIRYDRIGTQNLTDNATVTTDIGPATSAARDRDTISAWGDQSASNNDAAQATVASRPTFRTSRTVTLQPALVFDGSGVAVDLASALTLAGDFTLMWVDRWNTGDGALLGHASGTGRIVQTNGTTLTVTNDAGAAVALTHDDLTGLDFKVRWLRRAGSTISCGIGSTQTDSDTLSGTISAGRIGRHGAATSPYNGELCQLQAYDGAMTSGQIANVAASLATTWGAS